MKTLTVNVQITKTPRPYESIKIGGEWSLDAGETEEQAMAAALELLNRFYAQAIGQAGKQTTPQDKATQTAKKEATEAAEVKTVKRQRVTYPQDLAIINGVRKRIEAGVSLDTVLKYYDPDDKAMKIWVLDASINTPTDGGREITMNINSKKTNRQ